MQHACVISKPSAPAAQNPKISKKNPTDHPLPSSALGFFRKEGKAAWPRTKQPASKLRIRRMIGSGPVWRLGFGRFLREIKRLGGKERGIFCVLCGPWRLEALGFFLPRWIFFQLHAPTPWRRASGTLYALGGEGEHCLRMSWWILSIITKGHLGGTVVLVGKHVE